jgi:hypothetical protein
MEPNHITPRSTSQIARHKKGRVRGGRPDKLGVEFIGKRKEQFL